MHAKIQFVLECEVPATQVQVRTLVGLTGYHRISADNYGSIVVPLTALTCKKEPKKVI